FHSVRPEIYLHPRIPALPLGIDDDTGTELGVHHVLADAKAADVARRLVRHRGARLARELRRERLLPVEARSEPFYQVLRNLFQEARRNVVARLPMQHARLRVRE